MMFDLWPVYSCERFRASWPSCFNFRIVMLICFGFPIFRISIVVILSNIETLLAKMVISANKDR